MTKDIQPRTHYGELIPSGNLIYGSDGSKEFPQAPACVLSRVIDGRPVDRGRRRFRSLPHWLSDHIKDQGGNLK